MVAVAVSGLQINIGGGSSARLAGSLEGLELGGLSALRVEKPFACNMAGGGGDDATEVGVRGGEASGLVGKVRGASDVVGLKRVIIIDSGLAEHRWPVTQISS